MPDTDGTDGIDDDDTDYNDQLQLWLDFEKGGAKNCD